TGGYLHTGSGSAPVTERNPNSCLALGQIADSLRVLPALDYEVHRRICAGSVYAVSVRGGQLPGQRFPAWPCAMAGSGRGQWALLRLAGPVPWSARRRASGSAGQGSVHSVTAKPEDAPVTMMRPLGSRSGRLLPPEMVTAWLRTAMRLTDRGLATFQTNV